MTTSSKIKYATEDFVYRVVGDSEKRLDKRFDEIDEKIDIKFDKVITQLDGLAGQFKKFDEEQTMQSGRIAIHSDEIKELQGAVFPNA